MQILLGKPFVDGALTADRRRTPFIQFEYLVRPVPTTEYGVKGLGERHLHTGTPSTTEKKLSSIGTTRSRENPALRMSFS
jgi:hypothetical protein